MYTYVLILNLRDASLILDLGEDTTEPVCGTSGGCYLDLLVENIGRANYGKPHDFMQMKGLWEGPVLLDGKPIKSWDIFPLEFKSKWVKQ